jgi:putative effector of murein hydrolase LrgA (UPF0299 family)
MIPAITVILLCQLLGEVAARAAGLPLPGPVLGMALLLAVLFVRDRLKVRGGKLLADGNLENACRFLLANLSLLFVPAGVGVVQRLDVLKHYGPALLAALVVSTILAMIAAVSVFRWVARRMSHDRTGETGA